MALYICFPCYNRVRFTEGHIQSGQAHGIRMAGWPNEFEKKSPKMQPKPFLVKIDALP
jgi:hypothetical protein